MTEPVYFPSCRYYRAPVGLIDFVIVQTPEEDRALGEGYFHSPADVPELEPADSMVPNPALLPAVEPASDPPVPFYRRGRPKSKRAQE